MSKEVWRPVPSHPEIEVSTWGRARRIGRVWKGRAPRATYGTIRTCGGYSVRTVHFKGVPTRLIHRLVAETFIGPEPFPGAIVLHLDDDTHNNRPENLRWGTRRENSNTGRFREVCRARVFERSRGRFVRIVKPGLVAIAEDGRAAA